MYILSVIALLLSCTGLLLCFRFAINDHILWSSTPIIGLPILFSGTMCSIFVIVTSVKYRKSEHRKKALWLIVCGIVSMAPVTLLIIGVLSFITMIVYGIVGAIFALLSEAPHIS